MVQSIYCIENGGAYFLWRNDLIIQSDRCNPGVYADIFILVDMVQVNLLPSSKSSISGSQSALKQNQCCGAGHAPLRRYEIQWKDILVTLYCIFWGLHDRTCQRITILSSGWRLNLFLGLLWNVTKLLSLGAGAWQLVQQLLRFLQQSLVSIVWKCDFAWLF